METIQGYQVSVVRFQAAKGDVTLVTLCTDHFELSISVGVLDLEGVKFSLSHHPGETQAVRRRLLHSQLPEVGRNCGGRGRGDLCPRLCCFSGAWFRETGRKVTGLLLASSIEGTEEEGVWEGRKAEEAGLAEAFEVPNTKEKTLHFA